MAAVLKSSELSQGSNYPQPLIFNVQDVQKRAQDYLAQVQLEAEQILSDARQQAGTLRAQAVIDGQAQAQTLINQRVEQSAQQLSDARCKTAIAACELTVGKISSETTQWLTIWRNQTVELAARIAEKLLRREMQDRQETLRVWMEEAIVALRESREIRVMVHPDDFAVAGRFLQQLAKSIPQASTVEILPDPEISLGGCVVRSTQGEIDQQLESQLQRLAEQLQ